MTRPANCSLDAPAPIGPAPTQPPSAAPFGGPGLAARYAARVAIDACRRRAPTVAPAFAAAGLLLAGPEAGTRAAPVAARPAPAPRVPEAVAPGGTPVPPAAASDSASRSSASRSSASRSDGLLAALGRALRGLLGSQG